ncbi:hypothetical protein DXX93_05100 [Thalassotalea euphylliae]|uniref:Pilus assembly protein PilX n=1 Tax=Thalassotalea euphylliae TaxID=1655234 RepID=A0A3E0TPV6_9GAMM|nr:pilus assembly PilX N-terminal domain-containing protein [Thalassotalea euphylliae]REL26005.1 hypothetical protein DXX93_05100 [Thalassotalea euphylliae]
MGLNRLQQQAGVVLIVALVFLISLTAVASALMLNSTADIKMSGASQEKLIANQEAISATDEVIANQITSGTNLFTRQSFPIPLPVSSVKSVTVDSLQITNRNFNNSLPDCPHSKLASSTEIVKCNLLNIEVDNRFGKGNTSNVSINSGIAQQILDVK